MSEDPWAAYPALEPGGASGADPWAKYPKAEEGAVINQPTGEARSAMPVPREAALIADDPERGASLMTIARASLAPVVASSMARSASSLG